MANEVSKLTMTPEFPEEDFRWLERQAAKHGVEIKDVINWLMDIHMPDGFRTERPMSEEEFRNHFRDLLRAMVRQARLGIQ